MRHGFKKAVSRITVALATSLACASLYAAEYMPNFKDTDINEFINIVGKNLQRTIIVDPDVRGKLSVRSYDLLDEDQYYQFFLNVLQVYDFAVVEMPSGILKVVRSKNAKQANIPVVEGALLNGDEMITRVVPVYNVPVRELSPILRQLNDAAGGGNVVHHDPSNVMMLTGRAAVVNGLVDIIHRVDQAGDEEVEIVKLKFASASEMVRIIESINKSQGKANTTAKAAPRLVADDRTNSVIISGDSKSRSRLKNLIERMDQELETTGNTRVIFLNYAKAVDLVQVLQGVSASIQADDQQGGSSNASRRSSNNRDVSIDAHEDSNSLVITAEPDMMRSLEEVIRQLDIRRAQVQVEAIVVEVFEGDGTTVGVQFGSEAGGGTQFTNGTVGIGSLAVAAIAADDVEETSFVTDTEGNTVVDDDGNAVTVTTSTQGDFTGLANLLGGVNGLIAGVVQDGWTAVLQAVSTDTNSNVLATPHLTTLDNEEAFFIVGQEVPIITGTTTSANNTNPFTTVDRQEVGIKLQVTPQINEGSAVQLLIEQEVSSVSGATAVDISINKREIKTTVIVDDGGTIVLGGLIDEDIQESVSKVPWLGDIPILGNLFKTTSSTSRKRNLMVFLRPTIIRDGILANTISQRKYNFIRAEQLKRQSEGVALLPSIETPVLPEWDDSLALPPSYDEFLLEKSEKELGIEKQEDDE
ncbi:type II secretion system secretin GspD [Alteromonas sp. 5E99-2]|uniref:type II secretion system secretin GspD n=1 Tax=Alteromonas sp. 5E99-2 TaxID=2817683 RepID=UPI001A994366|nr:type II secretion system secretin GspD [Alteromonas sp. 5E99-2]MBO1256827.1 type II secretion system secretin GspD [Alteromonas sp. 5E99-2]